MLPVAVHPESGMGYMEKMVRIHGNVNRAQGIVQTADHEGKAHTVMVSAWYVQRTLRVAKIVLRVDDE